jgi:hypothetical protein
MKRPSRKPPVFVRCPVCGTEFRRRIDYRLVEQRWCTRDCAQAARRHARAGAALPEAATGTVRTRKQAKQAAAPELTPEAIRDQIDAAAGTNWRELVRRPMRKDRP